MIEGERYLLVITKNKSSIVLECPGLSLLDNWQSKAGANGAVCKTFSVDEILEILDAPLEDHGEAEDLFGGNIFH